MKPVEFKEQNKNLLKPSSMTDEECGSLPVFSDGELCVSCWSLSIKERIKMLFTGVLWLGVYSGKSQPPVWITADKPLRTEI